MNAKFLERFVFYREAHRLEVAKVLISQKIIFQFGILKKKAASKRYVQEVNSASTVGSLFLIEARAARAYWKLVENLLLGKIDWQGRAPQATDTLNKMIDIGYHYIRQDLTKSFERLHIPTELGFFHKAQSAYAHPLVYDFMEWLRPVVVDRVLIKMLHKKKKKINDFNKKFIPYFISKIKEEGQRLYFHRKLGYCITLNYWNDLVLLELIRAVNDGDSFKPFFPSLRNESRCKKKPPGNEPDGL